MTIHESGVRMSQPPALLTRGLCKSYGNVQALRGVDLEVRRGEPTEIATRGRHDPCLLPRFVPMGEAMMALVLVDHWLRWRAGSP